MVFYFSGTGNSRYIAQQLSEQLSDELVSMNRLMRQRKLDPYTAQYAFTSEDPFVVVCPTYCWHVPKVVEEFLLGFVRNAQCTLHIRQLTGSNSHHIIECAFKALGRCLRAAVAIDPACKDEIPSTKGVL